MAIRGNGVVGEMIIFLLVAALIWHSGQFTSLGKGWHLKKYGGSGIYNDWTKPIFAHNNLSYGTIVEIRNPKNGRKVRAICYDKMASKTKMDVAPKYLYYLCGKTCSGFRGEYRIVDTSIACSGQGFKCMRSKLGAYLEDDEVVKLKLGVVK